MENIEKNENIEVETSNIDYAAIGAEMAKGYNSEMEAKDAREKASIQAQASEKIAKANQINIVQKDVKCGEFKSVNEMEVFAKNFVPQILLQNNKAALSTYQNIATDADGGSFDPTWVNGLLANSTEVYPSYVEDTLQAPVFNSVGTFIDHTSDATTTVVSEGVAGAQSKPGNTTRTITQKKLLTLCPITGEVLRFGTLADVANETLKSMRSATSKKKQHLIFTADGTADTNDGSVIGTIKAIENVGAGNSAIYTVNGNWDAIDNDDISAIATSVASWANPAKYAWYCHKNMWGFIEGIARALGGNQYLVQTNQRPIPLLFGSPIRFVNQMPASFVEDEIGMLFGDLSSMTATGSNGEVYVDMNGGQWFDQDTVAIRLIEHMGVNVFQPGSGSVIPGMRAIKFSAVS